MSSLVSPASPPLQSPWHVAIIMDGNGRWATRQQKNRSFGHRAGMKTLEAVVKACPNLGIKYLSVYAFSVENWERPAKEVDFMMNLFFQKLQKLEKDPLFFKNGIAFRLLGDRSRLSPSIAEAVCRLESATAKHSRFFLQVGLSYSGRDETVRACQKLVAQKLSAKDVNADVFSSLLDTAGLPDPDILVRTGGEKRLSNFLLWQMAYTELFFVDTCWPDFTPKDLEGIIQEFQMQRQRRFGKI